MGTQGVPLNLSESAISECIKKRKGVITHICKDLDVSHTALTRFINDRPHLKDELDHARHEYDDLICDLSENTMLYAVSQKEDLGSALSAAKFVLNNKGRKRGYNADGNNYEAPGQPYFSQCMKQAADTQSNEPKPETSPIDSGSTEAL